MLWHNLEGDRCSLRVEISARGQSPDSPPSGQRKAPAIRYAPASEETGRLALCTLSVVQAEQALRLIVEPIAWCFGRQIVVEIVDFAVDPNFAVFASPVIRSSTA